MLITKKILILFIVSISFLGCENWVLIHISENADKHFYDSNSIKYLDENKNSFEVITKIEFSKDNEGLPPEYKPWKYKLSKIVIRCNSGEMKPIESIVYYRDGTNSGWNDVSQKGFFIPKSNLVSEERDFICKNK